MCADLFIVVVEFNCFFSLASVFQLFNSKHCLQISGLRMRNVI